LLLKFFSDYSTIMQLLNSLQDQLPVYPAESLLETLEDIVKQVQIQSNFCVSHPDFKPLELPPEVVERFQQVPLDLQNKYLSLQVRSFLYGIYYNGSLRSTLAIATDHLVRHQDLANNTVMGVDLEFSGRLHESNQGEGYFNPGWCVVREETDGALAVTKEGLTLHIDRDRHLELPDQSIAIGDWVSIRMPRNLIQNGFYQAVSNAGTGPRNSDHSGIVRIYFNLTAEGAVSVMASLTGKLNETQLPFTFKVLYNPADYDRYDSGVLYFDKSDYATVRQVVQTIHAEHREQFQPEVPLFTKLLAPGLALAEEPDQKFTAQESFGMNRCQIVTNGLLEAEQKGDHSPEARMVAIRQHFSLLGIDLQHPYLNAKSEDIYTPFDLC
jgi:HopA1 effector protein family